MFIFFASLFSLPLVVSLHKEHIIPAAAMLTTTPNARKFFVFIFLSAFHVLSDSKNLKLSGITKTGLSLSTHQIGNQRFFVKRRLCNQAIKDLQDRRFGFFAGGLPWSSITISGGA